jgi:hypothetical protein
MIVNIMTKSSMMNSKVLYKSQLQKTEWTFLDKSTKKYTHALHLYPARMHPEIAKQIIKKYVKNKTDVILDPFMGSGGVLLETILYGNDAIGIDINPFAVLLTKVKTTPIQKNLNIALLRIISNATADYNNKQYHKECLPDNLDLQNWYNPNTVKILGILKHHIFKIRNKDVQDFFKVCFSLTIRKTSYQRNSSWKIHRISEMTRASFNPNPISMFKQIAQDNIYKMQEMINEKPKGTAHTLLGDSRDITGTLDKISHTTLKDRKANLVITSPPYGDHQTTVAYGQFSKHSNVWLELEQELTSSIDSQGLGGKHKPNNDYDLNSDTLNTTLDRVRKNDIKITKNKKPNRDKAVYSFFYDLDVCLYEISKNLVPRKSHCCFVVANRTVRRIVIPTDLITMELANKYGFKVEKIIQRHIPNKAMPSKNAPENIRKETGNTMTQESVIIMRY